MKVGDRVLVKDSVSVYHHPQNRNQKFDLKGQQGEIISIIQDWKGRPISPNLPILVKFDKRFKVHFRENELETVA